MSSVLADKDEIRELKHQYCYATDALDAERLVGVFTEDGLIDVPLADPIEGYEEIREYLEWFGTQAYETRAHNVLNPIIEVNGDTARGEWYYMVVYALPGGNLEVGHGRYDDEFVRTDDGWKLSSVTARRRITREVPAERIS